MGWDKRSNSKQKQEVWATESWTEDIWKCERRTMWEKKMERDVSQRAGEQRICQMTDAGPWKIIMFNLIIAPVNILKFFCFPFPFFFKSEVPMNLTVCPHKKGL